MSWYGATLKTGSTPYLFRSYKQTVLLLLLITDEVMSRLFPWARYGCPRSMKFEFRYCRCEPAVYLL